MLQRKKGPRLFKEHWPEAKVIAEMLFWSWWSKDVRAKVHRKRYLSFIKPTDTAGKNKQQKKSSERACEPKIHSFPPFQQYQMFY